MKQIKLRPEPYEVLFRIQRGLAGYISYLAACDVNTAFSEYVLYEPILRILMSRGYAVRCEFPCLGIPKPVRGDCKKVDFEATKSDQRFALEVKWARERQLNIANDRKKLLAFHEADSTSRSFLCIFGRMSDINKDIPMKSEFTEKGSPVFADFHRTKYGCRIYELNVAS
jgi:hypothetical protein